MDTMLLKVHLWADKAFRQLSRVGRLAYIELSRLCDDNWGHTCYPTLHELVLALCPEEAVSAAYGDAEAQAVLAEVRAQIVKAVELGLLVADDTRDGYAVGYTSWEKYTGASRRRRGCPRFAMGPRIAATRTWSKQRVHPDSLRSEGFATWVSRCGLATAVGDQVADSNDLSADETDLVADEVDFQTATRSESADGDHPSDGLIRGTGYGVRGTGSTSHTPRVEEAVEKKPERHWPPRFVKVPKAASNVVRAVAGRVPATFPMDPQHVSGLMRPFEAFTDAVECESYEEWIVALALETKARAKPEQWKAAYARMLREHTIPDEKCRREARRLLGEEQDAPKPQETKRATVMVCPECGWEDASGRETVCDVHRDTELVPKEPRFATQEAPGSHASTKSAGDTTDQETSVWEAQRG